MVSKYEEKMRKCSTMRPASALLPTLQSAASARQPRASRLWVLKAKFANTASQLCKQGQLVWKAQGDITLKTSQNTAQVTRTQGFQNAPNCIKAENHKEIGVNKDPRSLFRCCLKAWHLEQIVKTPLTRMPSICNNYPPCLPHHKAAKTDHWKRFQMRVYSTIFYIGTQSTQRTRP